MFKFKMANIKKRAREQESGKSSSTKRFQSAALLRITKDMNDLSLPSNCKIDFPNRNDLFRFQLTVVPDEGFYEGLKVDFALNVESNYPFTPPKVKCLTEIYHPNIDCDGNVCLNILRCDWKPVLSISSVIYGLQHLLLEPNPNDPLNEAAAEELRFNKSEFAGNVLKVAKGLIKARQIFADDLSYKDYEG